MHLDVVTLTAAGSFVAALSGLLLTGAWTQMRAAPALLWWAAANFVFAVGVGIIAGGAAAGEGSVIVVGGALTSASAALVWAGTRTFVHRSASAPILIGGAIVWFVAAGVSLATHAPDILDVVEFATWIGYMLASNWELWRTRAEPLKARWPLMVLFSIHALIFLGGIYDVVFQKLQATAAPALDTWFGLINVEALVYAFATAIFMVVMCQERSALGYIKAAHNDALTGAASRGAFFAGAERILDRCRVQDAPLSVIEFDLDDFKSINDARGHAVGDQVLRLFADTTRGVLRANDFFGRHGGEEFAVVLPGTSIAAAYVVADRARHAFAEAGREIDGIPVYATVSAGVSAAALAEDFSAALEAADRALYRAKHRGRNRVERADEDRPDDGGPNIIRVA